MYSKCGELSHAAKVFDEMPLRDTVSWNVMIAGYLRNGNSEMGFGVFRRMYELGVHKLDHATLTTVASACDVPDLLYVNKMIHCLVHLSGYDRDITIGNALLTSYFNCGCFNSGRRVFDDMLEKNVVTWTAIISGLAHNQLYKEGIQMFVRMCHGLIHPNILTYLALLTACSGLQALKEGCQVHGLIHKLGFGSDIYIESALMDMYSKCGSVDEAWKIFESAEKLDEVSMTVILAGLVQNGFKEEAIWFFVKMVKAGIRIDSNVVSIFLSVFCVDTSLCLGEQIHSLIIKKGFFTNPFVGNGLINMYSKCGDLKDSVRVFHEMLEKNSVSWNSMIAAFARHGDGLRALHLYEEMRLEGVNPTDVTFLSLLHACSHVGLVEKGMMFLGMMTRVHGMHPRPEHYACVVDMLGRAGLLNEAKRFIEELPEEPDVLVWQALLGACSFYGDSEVGKYAADHLLTLAPENPSTYILMANIYSSKGKWRDRSRALRNMQKTGLNKDVGISWIEIDKKMHSFVVGDTMHPEAELTYGVLAQMLRFMRHEGYVPDEDCSQLT